MTSYHSVKFIGSGVAKNPSCNETRKVVGSDEPGQKQA